MAANCLGEQAREVLLSLPPLKILKGLAVHGLAISGRFGCGILLTNKPLVFCPCTDIKIYASLTPGALVRKRHPSPHPPPHYLLTVRELVITRDPDILGGEPVFAGTRVPVKTLTDYLEAGDSIGVFLDDFPTVSRAQVIAFIEQAR